jgi:methylenetetrahydrofolate dehydrogenase (NADP+)/methenyltetrahydrofolate cyclohydrolase
VSAGDHERAVREVSGHEVDALIISAMIVAMTGLPIFGVAGTSSPIRSCISTRDAYSDRIAVQPLQLEYAGRVPADLRDDVSQSVVDQMRDNRLLDGRAVRDRILDEVAERVRQAAARHAIGRLVSISIGEQKAAAVYVRGQTTAAKRVGLGFEEQIWPGTLTQEECKARIVAMNDDADVLGVILQRPVPAHINGRSLASAIHPLKDIEGMNPASIGDIVYNDLALAPCTAAASVELIKATGLHLHGLEVVMVGHSEIVGKPAALMLMAEGATVTVCHHLTRSVAAHSRRADAVLVAVGKPRFLHADMVKPGAAVIDIGINLVTGPDGETAIVGDVDTDSVKEVASWVTPVPGGVGPVTVAMFMRNAITAHGKQLAAGWLG